MKRSTQVKMLRASGLLGAGAVILYATYYISTNVKEKVDFKHSCRVISIYDNINSCKLDYTDDSLKVCDTAFSKESFDKTTLKINYAVPDNCIREFGDYCKFAPEGSVITQKAMAIGHYKHKYHIVRSVFERNGNLIYSDFSNAQNQTPDPNCRVASSSGGSGHGGTYANTTGRHGFGSLGGSHGAGG